MVRMYSVVSAVGVVVGRYIDFLIIFTYLYSLFLVHF